MPDNKRLGQGCCSVTNLIFHVTDTICGLLIIIDSILILSRVNSFHLVVFVPVYLIVFGLLICLFVIYAPLRLYAQLLFYFNFCGRGITFLFIGSILISFGDDLSIVAGICIVFISFIYFIMSIITKFCGISCSLPPPIIQYKKEFPPRGTNNDEYDIDTIREQQDQIWRAYLQRHNGKEPRTIHIFFKFGENHRKTTIGWTYKDAEDTFERNTKTSNIIMEYVSSDDDEHNDEQNDNVPVTPVENTQFPLTSDNV
eukprot:245011_1